MDHQSRPPDETLNPGRPPDLAPSSRAGSSNMETKAEDIQLASGGATAVNSATDDAEAGWTTVGEGRKEKSKTKGQERSPSARPSPGSKGKERSRLQADRQKSKPANSQEPRRSLNNQREMGDGRASFYKLQELLQAEAPPEYVHQMVVRIHELAKQRRYDQFKNNSIDDGEEKAKALADWSDSMPTKMAERYANYMDTWDYSARDDNLQLEQRTRVFTFVNNPTQETYMPVKKPAQNKSYKDALQSKLTTLGNASTSGTRIDDKLFQIATQPMAPLMKPREMTSEEREILDLILSQKLEIKQVPPFLAQVFDAGKLAMITELLQHQEYPLYAHLLAGHFLRDGISQNALLQMLDAGEAGLPVQQQQVQQLKADLKRNAVLRIDTYRFSILLLKGKICPTEMHALLTKELKLEVVALTHPILGEQQHGRETWEVIVDSPGCPEVLKTYSRIRVPNTELLIHHSDVHLHLPCAKCNNRWHSHAHCKVKDEDRKQVASKRILTVAAWTHVSPIENEAEMPAKQVRSLAQLFALFDRMNTTADTCGDADKPSKDAPHSGTTERTLGGEVLNATAPVTETSLAHEGESEVNGDESDMEVDSDHNIDNVKPTSSALEQQPSRTLRDEVSHPQKPLSTAGADGPSTVPPSLSPLKRARANTTAENQDDTTRGGSETYNQEGTTKLDNASSESTQNSSAPARRETKISRQGSNPIDCSVAAPAAKSHRAGPPKSTLKQLSLHDVLRKETPTSEVESGIGTQEQNAASEATANDTSETEENPGPRALMPSQCITKVVPIPDHSPPYDDSDTNMMEKVDPEKYQTVPLPAQIRPLRRWLEALGGAIIDVELNGQCGWLALFAATHNLHVESLQMTHTQILDATAMKKKILNVLLAKIYYLDETRAIDLDSEPGALYSNLQEAGDEPTIDGLARYWDVERNRSVDIPVPKNCWVDHTVLKGATLFLREPIYVIDVHDNGNAHLGMYAFKLKMDENGNTSEFPYFKNLNAGRPMQMLIDLHQADVHPVVLVLKRAGGSNHFQAVTYPGSGAASLNDTKEYDLMVDRHQDLLSTYGIERLPRGKIDMRTISLLAYHTVQKAQKMDGDTRTQPLIEEQAGEEKDHECTEEAAGVPMPTSSRY